MPCRNADDLVPFVDVTVLESTVPALLCRVGDRSVWLPRQHISGRLWCVGDCGRLLIRRWVARERDLIELRSPPLAASALRAHALARLPRRLRLVREERRRPGASER